jgi:hypothetical protein
VPVDISEWLIVGIPAAVRRLSLRPQNCVAKINEPYSSCPSVSGLPMGGGVCYRLFTV